MTVKALEAAPDAAIVAKAMACSEWPKWLFDLTDLTNRAADEADMSTEQAVAFAVLSYLSALPGEAEVVERLRKLTSPDAELLSDGYRLTEIIKLNPADALQAMQARAEKAERERDEALGVLEGVDGLGQKMVHDLKARVKVLEEERDALRSRIEEQRVNFAGLQAVQDALNLILPPAKGGSNG